MSSDYRRKRDRRLLSSSAFLLALAISTPAPAQSAAPSIRLVVDAGRPLRLALDRNIRVKRVGQAVTAILLEPVYAYDRLVVPAGTKALGHIYTIESGSKKGRVRLLLARDLTPRHRVLLQFDTLMLRDGRAISIKTNVTPGRDPVVWRVAEPSRRDNVALRAREDLAREIKQAVAVATAPGKLERLKDAAIASLPYHPEFLRKGAVFTATLRAPLDFGSATPTDRASLGTAPAPDSILNARLTTSLSSERSQRGTRIEAILTQPVFSADSRLIFAEGTRLIGQVTFARSARRFHRNGQLRFLFERVELPAHASEKLLASLYSVESDSGNRLVVDDEGGTRMTSSRARFAAPALGTLALVASLHGRLDYDTDGAGPETEYGGVGSSSLGGWLGLAGLGVGLGQISRPVSLMLTVAGLARTTYTSIFGRGRNVTFPPQTSIQLQLAPRGNAKSQ